MTDTDKFCKSQRTLSRFQSQSWQLAVFNIQRTHLLYFDDQYISARIIIIIRLIIFERYFSKWTQIYGTEVHIIKISSLSIQRTQCVLIEDATNSNLPIQRTQCVLIEDATNSNLPIQRTQCVLIEDPTNSNLPIQRTQCVLIEDPTNNNLPIHRTQCVVIEDPTNSNPAESLQEYEITLYEPRLYNFFA